MLPTSVKFTEDTSPLHVVNWSFVNYMNSMIVHNGNILNSTICKVYFWVVKMNVFLEKIARMCCGAFNWCMISSFMWVSYNVCVCVCVCIYFWKLCVSALFYTNSLTLKNKHTYRQNVPMCQTVTKLLHL
jgi:hypothetical protein